MRSLAGPRQDLDDLVQQAAERALRALDRFEGRCALSTFTYGIVYRTMLDHDRWYRRFRRRFAATAEARESALLGALSQAGVDTLELATDDELFDAILRFADLRGYASAPENQRDDDPLR